MSPLVRSARASILANPHPWLAATVAVLAGLVVFGLATTLFPYHSINHDEGVYLLQASMLLDGRFVLDAGPLADSFRPWFFVEDGGRLYPKYAPVPAAFFAGGMALGEPRISLALIAAGNTALVYLLAAAAWDRRTGVVAALALVGSPLFLLSSSVFLPYAPTALLTLSFAIAYVRAVRRSSVRYAALAGGAIGLAFFARPYTAVLFAAPFVVHACWTIAEGVRSGRGETIRSRITQPRSRIAVLGTVALFGLLGVLLALLYNRVVTGSALSFPYEAFAPLDGPGFGRRRMLGHSIEYTPALAVRANAHVCWYLLTRWVVLGPIGAVLAIVGVAVHLRACATGAGEAHRRDVGSTDGRRGGESSTSPTAPLDESTLRWLLLGVACSVIVGNVAFWGNYNALATMTDPTDGLLSRFGPFYHFDLLVVLSVFAGAGVLAITDRVHEFVGDVRGLFTRETVVRPDGRAIARFVAIALVVVSAPAGIAAEAAVLGPPIERNAAHTEAIAPAYAPFEAAGALAGSPNGASSGPPSGPVDDALAGSDGVTPPTDLENALVFLPTPYGNWLAHPFQPLRNDPDLAGETVYALDLDPGANFAVVDAYPDRDLYRYTYRGQWPPDPHRGVIPKLEPMERRSGERLDATVTVGVPPHVEGGWVTVTDGRDREAVDIVDAGSREAVDVAWTLTHDATRVDVGSASLGSDSIGDGAGNASSIEGSTESIALPDEGTVSLLITLVQREGSTLTYRLDLAVRTEGDRVEVLWPAETKVCLLTTDCGYEGAYVPDHPEAHLDGVAIETTLDEDP